MPYSSVKDTPAYVQKLGAKKARQWMHIVNQCLADGKPEARCFAMANGVVKRKDTVEGEQWDDTNPAESDDFVLDLFERAFPVPLDSDTSADMGSEKSCSETPDPDPAVWLDSETPVLDTLGLTSTGVKPQAKGAGLVSSVLQALGFRSQPRTRVALPATLGEGLFVTKQADGRWRWVARYSNAWQDRDREIVTEAAHKEYVEWVYAQKEAGNDLFPELWLWHTPGTRFGRSDWLEFADGFAHASGLIDDTPAAKAVVAKLAGQRLGVSHGMLCKQQGKYITEYRSFEISVLPLERASVWTTDFNVVGKETEAMAFTAERRKWLVDALGEPQVVQLEANTGAVAAQLKELGVEYKSVAEADEDNSSNVSGVAAATLAAQVADLTNAMQGMATVVKSIRDDVEHVKKADDDKVADAWLARVKAGLATERPTESAGNVVTTDKAKQTGQPNGNTDFLTQMVAKQFGIVPGGAGGATGNAAVSGMAGNSAAGTPAAAGVIQ